MNKALGKPLPKIRRLDTPEGVSWQERDKFLRTVILELAESDEEISEKLFEFAEVPTLCGDVRVFLVACSALLSKRAENAKISAGELPPREKPKCLNCNKDEGLTEVNVCGKHKFHFCFNCLTHFKSFVDETVKQAGGCEE